MRDEERKKLFSIKEVSRRLKVSTKQLRQWHKYGTLRAIQLIPMSTSPLKYTEETIEQFLQKHTEEKNDE